VHLCPIELQFKITNKNSKSNTTMDVANEKLQISYADLGYIAERAGNKARKLTGVDLTNKDILTLVKIAVYEYGIQCVENNKNFKLRRWGAFLIKDCKAKDENVGKFIVNKKERKRVERNERLAKVQAKKEDREKLINGLEVNLNDSNFAALNGFNQKTTIINNPNWNGNFGKSEYRPPIRQVDFILHQDDEQGS
jgi:hypothetical protein